MNAYSTTPASTMTIAYRLPPEALNAPKLPELTKNQPTTATRDAGPGSRLDCRSSLPTAGWRTLDPLSRVSVP